MNLQTFSWGSQSSTPRYPTAAELRNMCYSGLAAGIKGVLSYDFSFDLVNNQPSLWSEFKTLRTDVLAIEGVLLNSVVTRVNTDDQELVESYWIYNNVCYVVVVNTSYTSSKNVSLALPSGYTGTATSLFARMPNTLSVSGTSLVGSIAAQAVEVYSIASSPTQVPKNPTEAKKINIYPNPVKNKLTISGSITKNTAYEITTTTGAVVQTGAINNNTIFVSNLTPGLYFIKIKTKEWYVQKFVKE